MKSSKAALDTLLEQKPESVLCEAQASQYMIDCYPYATRGFLWGLVFAIILWGILISTIMLVMSWL
ncbi:MAG: hypothetical protein HC908_08020 [Calothrix sp. SM1_7_51]|nr:hypothetical protein [Calothrix sp. SM1_7_51]